MLLHVYDLGLGFGAAVANKVLRPLGSGVFHCGVEVYGTEWSYGGSDESWESGVFPCKPRECPGHMYSETVALGETPLCCAEANAVLSVLQQVWFGCSYSMFNQNCYHFADAFCRRLLVQGLPDHVQHLPLTLTCLASKSRSVAGCCRSTCGSEQAGNLVEAPSLAQRPGCSIRGAHMPRRRHEDDANGMVEELFMETDFQTPADLLREWAMQREAGVFATTQPFEGFGIWAHDANQRKSRSFTL